jgi:hypothetical protein
MENEKKITISGLNFPGKKFINKVVTYDIRENRVYVNGKIFFSGIKVVVNGNKIRFFDEFGEINNFNNSIEKFIQQIFSDKYYKFKGNKFVRCFTCYT